MISRGYSPIFDAYWEEFKQYAESTNKQRKLDWEAGIETRVQEIKKTRRWRSTLMPMYAELVALAELKFYDDIPITVEAYMDYCVEKGYRI